MAETEGSVIVTDEQNLRYILGISTLNNRRGNAFPEPVVEEMVTVDRIDCWLHRQNVATRKERSCPMHMNNVRRMLAPHFGNSRS